MLNISPLEVLVIGLLALVLFGPRRLPEIARRAGDIARELRQTTDEFRSGLEREYQELIHPLQDMGREARQALEDEPAPEPKPAAEHKREEPSDE